MSDQKNKKKNYKDTLNLPSTTFDMRAGLVKKEPAIQKHWAEQNLYRKIREAREDETRFVLHDGPPFANGNIHMGTALNKVLKDMVLKVKTMEGFDCPYVPGWDCHGQPIEQKIVEQLGDKMEHMTPAQIRELCYDYAAKYQQLQSEQFERLGVLGDFANPYLTMSPKYEAAVLESFARMVEEDVVYKQLRPVHWSIENRTALAEAELEYKDREDQSVFVAFEIRYGGEAIPHEDGDRVSLMIWTTTPWTLPANLAVAVHPQFTYQAVRCQTADGPQVFVLAAELREKVFAAIQAERGDWLESHRIVAEMTGQELIDAKVTYRHPVSDEKYCGVVAADYVTLEDGTGLVHTAPGHGAEDYGTALKCGLDIYCPVQDDGTYDDTVPEWLVGKSVWAGNKLVTEHLIENKALVLQQTIVHSYPHDWRSKTPTIFRATEQWFVSVDKSLNSGDDSLREMAMRMVRRDADDEDGVRFIPGWGRNRFAGMIESRPDWCLSRQRSWGLPIPAFYNADGEPLLTPASIRAVAKVIRQTGSTAWFTSTPKELLAEYDQFNDPNANPDRFPIDELTIGQDIFDVWFESGNSWYAVAMTENLVEDIPVDLYLEGSDQHRGWFQLSLLPALATRGSSPFRTVLTHGFVVDENGRKMSKSLGNTIDVMAQLEKRGADILRLWISLQDYQNDVRCSEKLIAKAEDAYRKIRNTLRFCMGSCFDFDPETDATDPSEHSVDLWMRMQMHELVRSVREAYDKYEFHRASRMIYEFCTVQASSIYLSAVKDRLYCESPNAIRRRASQTVIHQLLVTLTKLLAPILAHTAEEAWANIPNRPADEPDSVHLARLPEYDEEVLELAEDLRPVNPDQLQFSHDQLQIGPAAVWSFLLSLRANALSKLEALRNSGVKNPLDAEAVLKIDVERDDLAEMIDVYIRELEDLCGVGYARIERVDLPGDDDIEVDVLDTREKYEKCNRSWKRRPDVGKNPEYPDLTARDAAVVEELR
ncbi:MAG: isoleucine--tRNA ligase, partial [Phycisphaerae bacterium]